MRVRWGLGPVFAVESLLNARRWQVYALRSLFVLLLLVGMVFVWIGNTSKSFHPSRGAPSLQRMAKVGEGFFFALTGIQISLVLLAAPAATAGSMGMQRARGTLLHMMVTDLSDTEIVLGTLAARLAPVVAMIVCGVPVTALAALFGGIDFGALVGAFVVSLALALLGCSLALTLSIWVIRMHELLMAVYLAEALWLLALPIWWSLVPWVSRPPTWFRNVNPYVLAFGPYSNPVSAGGVDFAVFAGSVLALSALLLGLAIVRLRRVVIAESGRTERVARWEWATELWTRVFPSWPSPTLDGNPLLWREWHRNRPSRLARWLWRGLLAVVWMLAAWGTYRAINEGMDWGQNTLALSLMVLLMFGFLMLSATAPTALAEERVRGSLDVLLTAPVSTRAIVVAKWWGIYRRVLVLLPLPLFVSVFHAGAVPDLPTFPPGWRIQPPPLPLTAWDRILSATLGPVDFLVSGALIVGVGLVLAVWVRRMGRAISLSVIAFFVIGLGWPITTELVFEYCACPSTAAPTWQQWLNENRWLEQCVGSLSPIGGPIEAVNAISQWYSWQGRDKRWVGLGIVILIKTAIAWLLLWLAIRTFDHCLGRVAESRAEERIVLNEPATKVA